MWETFVICLYVILLTGGWEICVSVLSLFWTNLSGRSSKQKPRLFFRQNEPKSTWKLSRLFDFLYIYREEEKLQLYQQYLNICRINVLLFHMTQFQIKGGRSVLRRDIFDVSGKRCKYFLKALSNRKFFCEEEAYKKSWKSWFLGVLYHLTA